MKMGIIKVGGAQSSVKTDSKEAREDEVAHWTERVEYAVYVLCWEGGVRRKWMK